jgi:H+/Cl- antiporter ClcA
MVRTLTNHAVFILSMLIAYLIKEFVYYLLGNFKRIQNDPYLDVAIGMLIIVIVFYPLYELMKKFGHHLVEAFIQKSQEVTNSSVLGLLLGFIILLFGLYCTYAWIWKKISVIKVIHKLIGLF